jgi:hypothetical protein
MKLLVVVKGNVRERRSSPSWSEERDRQKNNFAIGVTTFVVLVQLHQGLLLLSILYNGSMIQ